MNDPALLPEVIGPLLPEWTALPSPIVPRLYSFWAGGPSPRPGVRRYDIVYRGGLELVRTLDRQTACDALAADLRLYVAERSRRFVFVHSGVVSWRGRAILFPGRSFSGKSRLVASLVRAGATYHSDEYAPLDGLGRVYPFALPLSLRDGDDVSRHSAEQLGGAASTEPVPVGLVVMSRFQPGQRWRPQRLSAGNGLLALLDNTIPVRRQPKRTLQVLAKVVSRAPVLRSLRGEADEVVPDLLRLAEAPAGACLEPREQT